MQERAVETSRVAVVADLENLFRVVGTDRPRGPPCAVKQLLDQPHSGVVRLVCNGTVYGRIAASHLLSLHKARTAGHKSVCSAGSAFAAVSV